MGIWGYGICPPLHAKTILTYSRVIVTPASVCDVFGFHTALPTPYSSAYQQQDSGRSAIDGLLLVPYSIVRGARYLIISWLDRKPGLSDLGHVLDFLILYSPFIFNSSTNIGEISILGLCSKVCTGTKYVMILPSCVMASDQ